jgi:hypothetical protein
VKQFLESDIIEMLIAGRYIGGDTHGFLSLGYYSDYDFSLSDGRKYEVKFDKMYCSTGNIAIEFWCQRRNKETGVLVTRADFWITAIPTQARDTIHCYEMPVSKLRRLCIEYNGRVTYGGDNSSNVLKLITLDEIRMIISDEFAIKNKLIAEINSWNI